jgi:hypothetical protein
MMLWNWRSARSLSVEDADDSADQDLNGMAEASGHQVLAAAFSAVLPLVPESREDLNPIAVSLLRKRLLRLECACVEILL